MGIFQIQSSRFSFQDGDRQLTVDFLSNDIVRFSSGEAQKHSFVSLSPKSATIVKTEKEDGTLLQSPLFTVYVKKDLLVSVYLPTGKTLFEEAPYQKDPYVPVFDGGLMAKEGHPTIGNESWAFCHNFLLHEDEHFYGLGDHPGPLDRRGYQMVNYNTDDPHPHEETLKSLYKSFPFFLVKRKTAWFGFYVDNPCKTLFDFGSDLQHYYFAPKEGADDFYFFYGPSPKEVLSNYTLALGRMGLPPRWSLGNQQCRWSYASEKEIQDVVDNYSKNDIPLEAIYYDIDYMDGYRVFTVSPERFPHLKDLIASLKSKGVKSVPILDPGIKVDPLYGVYQEAIKNHYVATYHNQPYVNEVWPGESVYPSFNDEKVRVWWGEKVAALLSYGFAGIWCDMNEPASFKGPLPDDVSFAEESHASIHNLYGHFMAQATYEGIKKATGKRPFVITRACFSGTEKYSTVWTGDNQSSFASLSLALPQQMALGLSGMPFVGTDIGGFGGDFSPKELMNRWIEVGVFSPLCRNHACCGNRHHEPYCYDKETLDNYRQWVYFRYRMIPYLYDLFHDHRETGLAPIRPLFIDYPDDEIALTLNDEFLWGGSLLVSPVLEAGARGKLVYLPQGRWYPFFGGESLGSGYHAVSASLKDCPLYAKEGAIIPLYPSLTKNLDKEPSELVLKVFPGNGVYLHYQDNGEDFAYEKGQYNLYEFTNKNGVLTYRLLHEGYQKYARLRVITPNGESLITL